MVTYNFFIELTVMAFILQRVLSQDLGNTVVVSYQTYDYLRVSVRLGLEI